MQMKEMTNYCHIKFNYFLRAILNLICDAVFVYLEGWDMNFSIPVGLFHCFVIGSLLIGAIRLFYQPDGERECKMTYMWENPEYAKISFTPEIEFNYSQYGLYLYGEGHYMKVVTKNFDLEGIPVLFIPGNAGSYKQSRSIGSVLLRKSQNLRWEPHFNVFTVDLNEELVGIYGGTLKRQVKFVNHCIKKILSMYKNDASKPTSVVVVGHSMGGIVGKSLFTDANFNAESINTILTYATPHRAPVANFDYQMNNFYEELNSYWLKNCEKLKHVSVLSVSGGEKDYHVNTALTSMPVCEGDVNKISTISSHVPRVHATASHQVSVWCNQLVLATTRALFDMIDPITSQISEDANLRQKVLHHHFVRNPGYKAFMKTPLSLFVNLTKTRTLVKEVYWSLDPSVKGYVSFDIAFLLSQDKDFIIARTDSNLGHWIFVSKETELSTLPAVDVSDLAFETPTFVGAQLNLTQLHKDGYKLVVFNLKSRKQLDIVAINKTENTLEYEMPHSLSNIWTIGKGYKLTLNATKMQFYHELNLIGFYSIFHAYSVGIEQEDALKSEVLQFDIPWQTGSLYSTSNNISLSLPFLSAKSQLKPTLKIYTNGLEGKILLIIKPYFSVTMKQLLRYYGPTILSMIAINILFAFTAQINCVLSNNKLCNFGETHGNYAKPYKIQPFISLLKRVIMLPICSNLWYSLRLPQPDFLILDNQLNIWFQFAPMCTFIFAYEAVKILNQIMYFLVMKLCTKFFMKSNLTFNKSIMFPIHIVAIAAISQQNISFIFLYIFIMHFLKTSFMAVQCSKLCSANSCATKEDEEKSEVVNEFELNYSLLFMWLSLFCCAVPSLLSAFKGHSTSNFPNNILAYSATGIFLIQSWRGNTYLQSTKLKVLSWLFFPMIVFCSLFAFLSLYRLPVFILFFMSLHTVMTLV